MKQAHEEISASLRLTALILGASLVYFGYEHLGFKGVVCVAAGTVFGFLSTSPGKTARDIRAKMRLTRTFLCATSVQERVA